MVDARGGDDDAHWLGTVEGGFANPLLVLESPLPVADLVGAAIGEALAGRGLRGGDDAPYALDVTVDRLGAVQYLRRRAAVSLSIVLRRRVDGATVLRESVALAAASGAPLPLRSGLLAPVEPLRDLLGRTLDAAIDDALDRPALRRALAAARPPPPAQSSPD